MSSPKSLDPHPLEHRCNYATALILWSWLWLKNSVIVVECISLGIRFFASGFEIRKMKLKVKTKIYKTSLFAKMNCKKLKLQIIIIYLLLLTRVRCNIQQGAKNKVNKKLTAQKKNGHGFILHTYLQVSVYVPST